MRSNFSSIIPSSLRVNPRELDNYINIFKDQYTAIQPIRIRSAWVFRDQQQISAWITTLAQPIDVFVKHSNSPQVSSTNKKGMTGFHSHQDCPFASSKFQVFVNSSGTILGSTEAAVKLLSFSPTALLQIQDTKRACQSAEEIEKKVQTSLSASDIVKRKGQQEDDEDTNLDFPITDNTNSTPSATLPSLNGQSFQTYFPDFEEKEGVIQPSELINLSLPDSSKWIYSCTHSLEQADKSITKVVYLQDVEELKEEYNLLTRNPIPLDSVKKKISLETPDFILESLFEYGEIMTMRISTSGSILQLFPLLEPTFLKSEKIKIQKLSIMALIHPDDHIILNQCLSECLKNGTCHFVIRWAPQFDSTRSTDPPHWVQMKAKKSSSESVIIGISQLHDPIAEKKVEEGLDQVAAKMVSSAWSYFTTSVAEVNQIAAPGLSSFFSVSREKSEKTAAAFTGSDAKMYFIFFTFLY